MSRHFTFLPSFQLQQSQQESVKDSVPLHGFSARVLTQGNKQNQYTHSRLHTASIHPLPITTHNRTQPGIWPSSMGRGEGVDAADVLLPPQMAQALDAFRRWYVGVG